MARSIIWDDEALEYLEKSLQWISKESIQQAKTVENGILEKIEMISENPERYQLDKYKKDNLGKHRAFESHSYRVAYTYSSIEVLILRVRHVKQEPNNY
jgi:plasmid stabilization system protein ParE